MRPRSVETPDRLQRPSRSTAAAKELLEVDQDETVAINSLQKPTVSC